MLEKVLCHYLAVQFTQIVMSKVKVEPPADASIADANLRATIDTTVELHKVFYNWIVNSFSDNSWKSPKTDIASTVANIVGLPSGQIGQLISSLVGKFITNAVSTPASTPLSGSSIVSGS